MVFNGKPSLGCQRCRIKRTKCDRKTPSCSQCIRAGTHCTGYRDKFSLALRDQTPRFFKQVRTNDQLLRKPSDAPGRESASSCDKSLIPAFRPVDNHLGNPYSLLSTPVEDHSICFFQVWILKAEKNGPNAMSIKSWVEYIPDMLQDPSSNSLLRHTVICLGKAGLAIRTGSVQTKLAAETDYAVALRLTNMALSNVVEAKSDQTLLTVMLLAFYEVSLFRREQSWRSWAKHMNGITALLQLRGVQQFDESFRLRLFLQCRAHVISSCFQRKVPVPSFFTENFPADAALETEAEIWTGRLTKIGIRFCNARALLTRDDFKIHNEERQLVISEFLCIDSEFETWARDCPEDFQYTVLNVKEQSTEFGFLNYLYNYQSMFVACIWNNYRAMRMHLNRMLSLRICRDLENNSPALRESQLYKCRMIQDQLALDVCASVPYCLGLSGLHGSPRKNKTVHLSSGAILGQRIMLPLYTAGVAVDKTNPMRSWIINTLVRIADLTGFQQAAFLSQDLIETSVVEGGAVHTPNLGGNQSSARQNHNLIPPFLVIKDPRSILNELVQNVFLYQTTNHAKATHIRTKPLIWATSDNFAQLLAEWKRHNRYDHRTHRDSRQRCWWLHIAVLKLSRPV